MERGRLADSFPPGAAADPTVLFAPSLRTDADGRVDVPVPRMTPKARYRLFAVASSGARAFGTTERTCPSARRVDSGARVS